MYHLLIVIYFPSPYNLSTGCTRAEYIGKENIMDSTAEKILQCLYDEYQTTGQNEYQNVSALSGIPSKMCHSVTERLKSLGYVKNNILGETKLTDYGISYFD